MFTNNAFRSVWSGGGEGPGGWGAGRLSARMVRGFPPEVSKYIFWKFLNYKGSTPPRTLRPRALSPLSTVRSFVGSVEGHIGQETLEFLSTIFRGPGCTSS